MRLRKLLLALTMLSTIHAFGQKNGTLTGMLLDSTSTTSPVGYATIAIYKGTDSVISNYKLSDEKGVFRLTNLEINTIYRVVITAWQFKVYRKEISILESGGTIDMGKILLAPASNSVGEVEIRAERPPIIVRNDTIEFNAESFKTLPSAVAEDMLKKLPGVVVGADGELQHNGRAVSKVLVEGKEFFGGDKLVATKNLPANIIDKIQISDDPEAKRLDPDLLPANTPQIINLKLKRAIKQGAFGKLYAGGGLNDFFEAGGIMNVFRDTTQISVLAYGNNLSKPGFSISDIQKLGGFQRSGYNTMMVNSNGGFALDNISFGGSGTGIQKSSGAGANMNTLLKGGIKINAKYFYGRNHSMIEQLTNDNQTLGTGRLITNSTSNSLNTVNKHNLSTKIEWQIDSLTKIIINPNVVLTRSDYNNIFLKQNSDGANLPVGRSDIKSLRANNLDQLGFTSSYWQDFRKKGRSLNVSLWGNHNVTNEENFNQSASLFYNTNTSTSIDQLRNNMTGNSGLNLSANYSEPLSKKLTLSATMSANYINNENALATFFRNPASQAYDIVVPSLTETVIQEGIKTTTRLRTRWAITKDLSVQPSLVLNTIDLNNTFTSFAGFSQTYRFVFPSVNVRYKAFSFDYTPSFEEPSVQYIQPVTNNTDPLFIQKGNAFLKPAKTQWLSGNVYKYDVKRSMNYNFNIYGSTKSNGVIQSREIDAQGVQTSTPINADDIYDLSMGANISKDFKNTQRQISLSTGFWTSMNSAPVEVNKIRSRVVTTYFNPRVGIRVNLNDKIEFTESFNLNINSARYDDPFFKNRKLVSKGSETELIIRYPKKLVFETNFRLQINDQKIANYSQTIKLWNAGLTYLFMKNDRAQLKLSVNDILQNGKQRFVYINENLIRDTQTNNIGRYGLLTFTYNIQNFGGKVGGKERFFGF